MAEAQVFGKPALKKNKKDLSLQIKNKKKDHLLEPQTHGAISAMNYTENPLSVTYRRTFHLGSKKYGVFHGEAGQVQSIHLKEWDGQIVTNPGIKLNISKLVVLVHFSELINHALQAILKGDKGIEKKVHIGSSYYVACNSPYKSVGIRKWKTNAKGDLFPTTEGLSCKPKEWEELVKVCNQMYSERMEIYTYVPCLIQPDQPNHSKLSCEECSHLDESAKGEVDVEIPL